MSDPLNVLTQGEATLVAGAGSQTSTGDRWGDYSAMTIDPVDDHTFWYTSEYYTATASVNWKTRIGNFKFPPQAPIVITSNGSTVISAGGNGLPDPGETVTVALSVQNTGTGGCTTALTGTLQATGGVTNPTPAAQNYGAVCTPNGTATQQFTFTVDPALVCGTPITASLVMTDGATNYGTLTYTFATGVANNSAVQNFDGVVAPALPAGWVATNASGPAPLWVTSTSTPDTAPNAAFIDDPALVSDKRLDSVGIPITSTGAKLSFRNNYNLESGFDGGVLEISSPNINAGAFTDITSATVGGSFASGGYNATISSSFSSPIAGRSAWSGTSSGYITTVANLGPNVAGQTIKLRFRMGSDTSVAGTAWRVDTITLQDGFTCDAPTVSLVSAVSRLNHTGVGNFDVPMPLTGTAGVEDRTGEQLQHRADLWPSRNLWHCDGNRPGTGTAGAPSFSGNTITVPLTGVTNAQVVTLTVSNVNGQGGSANVNLGFLIGDTNGDGLVNNSDISQTKGQSGVNVGASNFREDVTTDGLINNSDISLVKSKSGSGF